MVPQERPPGHFLFSSPSRATKNLNILFSNPYFMRNGGPASRWGCRVQSEAGETRPREKASASLTPPTLGRTGAIRSSSSHSTGVPRGGQRGGGSSFFKAHPCQRPFSQLAWTKASSARPSCLGHSRSDVCFGLWPGEDSPPASPQRLAPTPVWPPLPRGPVQLCLPTTTHGKEGVPQLWTPRLSL